MDETLLLVGLSILLISLFIVLLVFKRKNTAQVTPTVRSVKKEIDEPEVVEKKDVKVNKTTRKRNKKVQHEKVEKEEKNHEEQLKEHTPKPKETVVENLFDHFYYDSAFDNLEPLSKDGNVEYYVYY